MVLESTMICLDNSDWMRNGDYTPTRIDAQQDAASLVCNDRTNSNPENTVGILTMAGNGVDLLVSPTEDPGKILASFAGIPIGGKTDLSTSVQVAQLALKHRKNKNGGQRIICFIGGPIQESVEQLIKIGKQLKKNNVAVDIISIGEIEENNEKLTEFVNTVNSNDNCHLITVPPGVSPVNAIVSSPIMYLGGGINTNMNSSVPTGGAAGGSDFDMYGGIDPSMDPELAMAIRVSTEEARAQEEARMKVAQDQTSAPLESSLQDMKVSDEFEDEEALMQKALEMSMKEMMNQGNDNVVSKLPSDIANEDEDEDLRRALELSVGTSSSTSSTVNTNNNETTFADPDFVNQLLGSVDQNDPLIQAALAQLNKSNNNKDDKGDNNTNDKKRKGDDV